jgi:hypothetical protein
VFTYSRRHLVRSAHWPVYACPGYTLVRGDVGEVHPDEGDERPSGQLCSIDEDEVVK